MSIRASRQAIVKWTLEIILIGSAHVIFVLRQDFCLLVDLQTLLLQFSEKWKKNIIIFQSLIYPPSLNIICFGEKMLSCADF